MVWKGPLRCRDEDLLGLGVAHLIFSHQLPGRSAETAIELFYKAQLNPWILVQPDFQFIASPGGNQRDSFVSGLRFEIVL